MKKIRTATAFLFLLIIGYAATAQAKAITINGKVTSFEESLPLEGVSITVKGSSTGTGTQADGTFSLPVVTNEKLLVFSLDGYERQEVAITKATEYNIILKRAGTLVYNCRMAIGRIVPAAIVK